MKYIAALLIASTLLAAGGAGAQPSPYAPIPPPQFEAGPPPLPPGPPARFVLEPGHWQWDGVRYVWIGRHWIARQPGYARYIPGHWKIGPAGGYRWIPGHWGR